MFRISPGICLLCGWERGKGQGRYASLGKKMVLGDHGFALTKSAPEDGPEGRFWGKGRELGKNWARLTAWRELFRFHRDSP